jgi:hypothetical protein
MKAGSAKRAALVNGVTYGTVVGATHAAGGVHRAVRGEDGATQGAGSGTSGGVKAEHGVGNNARRGSWGGWV